MIKGVGIGLQVKKIALQAVMLNSQVYSSGLFLKFIKLAHIRNRVVSEVKFPLDAGKCRFSGITDTRRIKWCQMFM